MATTTNDNPKTNSRSNSDDWSLIDTEESELTLTVEEDDLLSEINNNSCPIETPPSFTSTVAAGAAAVNATNVGDTEYEKEVEDNNAAGSSNCDTVSLESSGVTSNEHPSNEESPPTESSSHTATDNNNTGKVDKSGCNGHQRVDNPMGNVLKGIGKGFAHLGSQVETLGKNLGCHTEKIGKDIGHHTARLGKDIGTHTDKIGKNLGHRTQSIGRVVAKFGTNVGDKAKQVYADNEVDFKAKTTVVKRSIQDTGRKVKEWNEQHHVLETATAVAAATGAALLLIGNRGPAVGMMAFAAAAAGAGVACNQAAQEGGMKENQYSNKKEEIPY